MPNYTTYTNKTMQICDKMNTVLYFCGMTNFWIADVKFPARFVKIYKVLEVFVELLMILFLAMEIGAFFTQNHLSPDQMYNLKLLVATHSVMYNNRLVLMCYKRRVRGVLRRLAVTLKQVYNDNRLDAPMMRQLTMYIVFFMLSCGITIVLHGANIVWQCIKSKSPLTTAITAWPYVEDDSDIAQIGRILAFLIVIVYFSRLSGYLHLIITILNCLRFQYKNLANYFEAIEGIFHKSREQSELEREFEAALRVGIKLHQDTLWCVQECRQIFSIVFSAQVALSLWELVAILCELVNLDRTLVNMAKCFTTASAVMVMAGFVLCTAGNVTVEATYLSSAMYGCGWQNCSGASAARVRKLLTPAMLLAQKPVDFVILGCVTVSYETYIAICKSSYSIFSVIY